MNKIHKTISLIVLILSISVLAIAPTLSSLHRFFSSIETVPQLILTVKITLLLGFKALFAFLFCYLWLVGQPLESPQKSDDSLMFHKVPNLETRENNWTILYSKVIIHKQNKDIKYG